MECSLTMTLILDIEDVDPLLEKMAEDYTIDSFKIDGRNGQPKVKP